MGRVLLIFFVFCTSALTATTKLDSLLQQLRNTHHLDTTLVNLQQGIGDHYGQNSNVDSTKYFYLLALKNAKAINFTDGEYSVYFKLARHYKKYQNYDSAFVYLDSAEMIVNRSDNKPEIFKILHYKGIINLSKKDLPKTGEYFMKALAIAKQEGLTTELAIIHNAIGAYEYHRGNHVVGLEHLSKAITTYEKLNNPIKLASVCNNLGVIYTDQKDLQNGKSSYLKGIHFLDSANITPPVIHKLYINLALLYRKEQQYDSAIYLLDKSISISEKAGNKAFNFLGWTYLTETYRYRKDLESAVESAKKTVEIAEELKSPAYRLRANTELAIIQNERGDFKAAVDLLLSNHALDLTQIDAVAKIRNYNQLCTAYRGLQKYDSSIFYGMKAFELSKKSQLKERVSNSAKILHNAYKEAGDSDKALHFYVLHKAYEDSIVSEKKSLEVGRLQARIENQKEKSLLLEQQKEKELELHRQKTVRDMLAIMVIVIAILAFFIYQNYRKKATANKLLREMNNEIREQKEEIMAQKEEITAQKEDLYLKNAELEQLNQEKNGLISVVAHDLRSPLNKNKGLANVIKLSGNLSSDQLNCINIIESVCDNGLKLIQEILYLNTVERQESQPKDSEVDLTHFLKEQVKGYEEMAKKKGVNFLHSIPKKRIFAILDPSYLARIVDNLMTNAIKYTHQRKNVYFSLQEVKGVAQITIGDEGQGFSEEDKNNMFKKFRRLSAQPTGGETSNGLGLSIVKNLIDKLDGKLSFVSEQGKGTEFKIMFPSVRTEKVEKLTRIMK